MLQIWLQSWKCDKKINFHYVLYPIFVKKYSFMYILRKLSNEIAARLGPFGPTGLRFLGPARPVDISNMDPF